MARRRPAPELSREQILGFRRRVGLLEERVPVSGESLRRAAWAGLQDSAPRAALLSLHARVEGAGPGSWEGSLLLQPCLVQLCLVQLWGPRFSDYVVAAEDLPVFSLGRMPEDARRRARAEDTAARLQAYLAGRQMPFGLAGRGMGVAPNSLRYAAPTGTVLIRWDGARQPVVWSVPAPGMDPREARWELARRYLHVFGPATPAGFARWAGVGRTEARLAFEGLASEVMPVRTPVGEAWILSDDEPLLRRRPENSSGTRLLPSGDAYFLLWGADRELLVPDAARRAELWTTRVWPGAVLVNGEVAGVWRRAGAEVSIGLWRGLSAREWEAVEAEALALPLPGVKGSISVRRKQD